MGPSFRTPWSWMFFLAWFLPGRDCPVKGEALLELELSWYKTVTGPPFIQGVGMWNANRHCSGHFSTMGKVWSSGLEATLRVTHWVMIYTTTWTLKETLFGFRSQGRPQRCPTSKKPASPRSYCLCEIEMIGVAKDCSDTCTS